MWDSLRGKGGTRDVDDKQGWIDKALGLNASRSFVEAGLETEYAPDSPLVSQKGDSDLTSVGRALLNVAAMPVTAITTLGGEALDLINKFPMGDFGAAKGSGIFDGPGFDPNIKDLPDKPPSEEDQPAT
jgi:hypothetical protein